MSPVSFSVLVHLFHLLPFIAPIKIVPPYTPTDNLLINCGASSSFISPDGRYWDGDARSKFLPTNSHTSIASTATQQNPSIPLVPYMTARIFNSTSTYLFPVSPGPKFIRLYFNPAANYSYFTPSESFFSIKANHYTLFHNFSAFLSIGPIHPRVDYVIKEFIIPVGDNQTLNITIIPSPKSTAFINGIEIVSMPDRLYASGDDMPVKLVGTNQFLYLDNSSAFETVYRINVGGASIDGVQDTGMFRKWLQDSDYIYGGKPGMVSKTPDDVTIEYSTNTPAFVAPELVYRTKRSMGNNSQDNQNYNLTWTFPVDGGFNYLVRLHFCETRLEVRNVGEEVFSIFINCQTAEDQMDVIYFSGGNNIPVYKDYVVWVPNQSWTNQQLLLALHPNNVSTLTSEALLNGVEILKLSDSTGSLASSNPPLIRVPSPTPSSKEKTKSKSGPAKVVIVVGPLVFSILAISLVTSFFICRQRVHRVSGERSLQKSLQLPIFFTSRLNSANYSLRPHNDFRQFSIFEIEVATAKFDDEFVIGSGGFGNVYKGFIDDGATPVAIKRLHSSSKQGSREFRTEIQVLSELRHQNLVSLVGYCNDPGEMILVYEFMQRGTLRDHLYKTKNPPLPWKRRLEMCIGAARGLHYLHTGAKHSIIHRDVKSTNILIDQNWVAKVSDFGLSRTGPRTQSETHVSTVVRGSFGYVDPEYYRRQQLTEKSDVYSFGVVLFEVLCARPAVIPGLPREQVNLCDWGRICYRRGTLGQIMDPNLMGDIDPVCMGKFGEIAESCLRDRGAERPTMSDVVIELELALQLQETAENSRIQVNTGSENQESPLLMRREAAVTSTAIITDDDDDDDDDLFSGLYGAEGESRSTISSWERSFAQSDHERFRSHSVFSELRNEKGR